MSDVLISRWDKLVAAQPDALAVIDNRSQWTRSELDARAGEWAQKIPTDQLLQQAVILCQPNGADWLAKFLALRRAGAIIIPVDAATSIEDSKKLAQKLSCFALQSSEHFERFSQSRKWPTDLALVKLTSGTSGEPTAIPFTEAELCADGDNIQSTMGIGPSDLNYALLPFAHSYALGNLVIPLLASGIPLVVGSAPLPRIIADEITRSGATVFPSVPTVFEALTRTDELSLGKLRLCITAAAPLTPTLAQRFRNACGLSLHNFYGASECGGIAYDHTGQCGLTGNAVGAAMDNVELSATNDGRLCVRSAAVSSFEREAGKDGRAIITLHDKVSFLDNGGVVIHGRVDRIVKCAGKRIDLAALEKVAIAVDGVERAAVVHETASDRLLVAIIGPTESSTTLTALQANFGAWRGRLRVKSLPELPVTLRGKVDYRELSRLLGG
ncbi:class I adenylate-forming enzyme family protein [Cerasicoccus arenae]|uniref:AMP-dependent synthetase/ligase domain-containing protein n=1 Tax=Cerasicoccus arenae TaxID=424488 RepID=A0A8J3DCV8_9BACT|nr:class I adenylate-forming enzyme family protein [Cerasicoccus arenae]MBK1858326.1 acyl--CoA ligase [Cerasicoccus arenae]GHB90792.1 hypothetical protein GCM10007047_02020 [Cerasicoccus arenae]